MLCPDCCHRLVDGYCTNEKCSQYYIKGYVVSLENKLRIKTKRIKDLKERVAKYENLKSLISGMLACNFADKETYKKALRQALRYN